MDYCWGSPSLEFHNNDMDWAYFAEFSDQDGWDGPSNNSTADALLGSLLDSSSGGDDDSEDNRHGNVSSKRHHQRNAANMRERRRMRTINDAFEGLRTRIPLVSNDRKLSKVDTLRLAIRYIHDLSTIVELSGVTGGGTAGGREDAKVIIRSSSLGYRTSPPEAPESSPLYGHSLSWASDKPELRKSKLKRLKTKLWIPPVDVSCDS